MLPAVPFKNVVRYIISFIPGKVYVKIRWRGTVWIDKTFKIQSQFHRINVRDIQTKSNDRISTTTPPDMLVSHGMSVFHYVPGDEKVRAKILLPDHS